MDALPQQPRTFGEIVESDRRRAARLIIKIQDEIDWQWRCATPSGDYHISVTMSDAVYCVGVGRDTITMAAQVTAPGALFELPIKTACVRQLWYD